MIGTIYYSFNYLLELLKIFFTFVLIFLFIFQAATMFAVMKDTDYATKPKFIENFMNDWRQILGKNHVIKKFELCDFTPIYEWHLREKEKKKQLSSEVRSAADYLIIFIFVFGNIL